MLITFDCTQCKTPLQSRFNAAGTGITCPQCGAEMTVPRRELGPDIIIGGFRTIRLLGAGGMGQVYLARQLSMDREVALKILPDSLPKPFSCSTYIFIPIASKSHTHPY